MSPSFAPRLLMTLTLCQTCTELFGCPTGWPEYNKHCYFFGNDRKSWWDARLECASKGAHLASILDQREQDWLQSLKKGARAWIGLRRETTGRPWQWADATPFYYSAWNGGEPNNLGGKENCVEMWPLGHWNDFPCALNLKSYICKRPVSPTTTTAKPVTCPTPAPCPTTTTAKPATCPTPAPCPTTTTPAKPVTCPTPAPAPTTAKPATCPTPAPCPTTTPAKPVTCPTPAPAPTTAKPATCPTPAPCPTTAKPATCPIPAPCPTTTPAKPVTCPTPAPAPTTAKPATCPTPAPCPTTAKLVTCPTPAPTTVKPATCPTPAPCPTTMVKPATSPAGPPPTDGELEMCAISTNDKACSSHNVTCSCLLAMIANPMGGFQAVLDGLSVARSIVIRGQSKAKAKRLVVNLDARDTNGKNATAALHLNMDLESQTFTLNSGVDRKWGDKQTGDLPRGRPFGAGLPFKIVIKCGGMGTFHLDFNDELQLDFAGPQLDFGSINWLEVWQVMLSSVQLM